MKSSEYCKHWTEENPVKDKMTDYIDEYPLDCEELSSFSWSEDDQIEFVEEIEKEASISFTDEELSMIFSPETTVGEFQEILKTACINKHAKITSMEQRAKMREYRMQNKGTLALKSKARRRAISQGSKIQMKRVGTAAGGYSFVMGGSSTNLAKPSKGSSISFKGMSPGVRKPKHFK